MFAEIITIGDELLIGQVTDTNSAWMGVELNKIGIEVIRKVSVRDREEEILEAVTEAMKRVDLVLVTGGLGPTKDDITKLTLCRFFNTDLVFSQEVYDNIKTVLGDRLSMNGLNRSQAMVPRDCVVINNTVGTASVSWFERGKKVLVSMPGVPLEMMTVMNLEILPRLHATFRLDYILHRTIWVKNYPESVLAEKLETFEGALPEWIKLAYLPKLGIIRLRLTGRGQDEAGIKAELSAQVDHLKLILGDAVYAEDDTPLEVILGEKLKEKGLTVSTAESCTGGGLAACITSIAGASEYYKGSVVAYSNEIKSQVLGVSTDTLAKFGAVSEQTVVEMVNGVKCLLGTDCAMATSGFVGPGGGTVDKPVGTVWIAVAYKNEIQTLKQEINRGRLMNIERACNNALLLLIDRIG
ncbi:MAG: CinA family nicotinamide mononucleotide deamidase-related protein [Bacteroides sp.]